MTNYSCITYNLAYNATKTSDAICCKIPNQLVLKCNIFIIIFGIFYKECAQALYF